MPLLQLDYVSFRIGHIDKCYHAGIRDIYRDHFGMVYQKIRYRISTSSLLGDTAQALRATSGTPAMVVERINYNQHGELIDCDIEYWRHDAISIESIAVLNH